MIELSEVEAAEAMVPGEFVSFPDSPFQLFQPYAPAGDQPRGDRAAGGRASMTA